MGSRHQQARTLVGMALVLGVLAVPCSAAAQTCADALNGMSSSILDQMYYAGEAMSWAGERDSYEFGWQSQWQMAPPPPEEQEVHDYTIAQYNAQVGVYAWLNAMAVAEYDAWNSFYSNPSNGCVGAP